MSWIKILRHVVVFPCESEKLGRLERLFHNASEIWIQFPSLLTSKGELSKRDSKETVTFFQSNLSLLQVN